MLNRTVGLGLMALLAINAPAVASAHEPCDRACLKSALDNYMDAVFKHSPSKAHLAPHAKATVNAAPLANGDGIWKTATGYGAIQRRFLDPVSSQAAYFGEIKEADETAIISLRVKVKNSRISEAEWTVARMSAGGMFSLEGLAETPPPPDKPLPASERTPRATLIENADKYFSGLQSHDGSAIPHIAGCERVENGFKVTNRVRPPAPSGPANQATPGAAEETRSGDCTAGFDGFSHSIAEAAFRRFPVVDEELGVVMGSTLFHRPPESTMKRNLLTEFFYQKSGKLSGIYAAMYYLEPSAPDGNGW
jgi:hypothetical protein